MSKFKKRQHTNNEIQLQPKEVLHICHKKRTIMTATGLIQREQQPASSRQDSFLAVTLQVNGSEKVRGEAATAQRLQ